MNRQQLELVGLLVTEAKTVGMYHIDYIYKIQVGESLTGNAIQKGFDWSLHVPFWDIVLSLSDAYAPALENRWTRRTQAALEVFMSFKHRLTPVSVGLGEGWVLDCER